MLDPLISWLHRHSSSVVRDAQELQFIHPAGSNTILVVRDGWIDDTVPLKSDALQRFYSKHWAASIGDGHMVIGTLVTGGISVSHGYRVPDLREMSVTAGTLGLPKNANLEVFMQQASWMFIYGMRPPDEAIMLFDRDFKELSPLGGIEVLLNQWWEIEQADSLEP